eukprot:299462-Hanusia_phi.AAC.2
MGMQVGKQKRRGQGMGAVRRRRRGRGGQLDLKKEGKEKREMRNGGRMRESQFGREDLTGDTGEKSEEKQVKGTRLRGTRKDQLAEADEGRWCTEAESRRIEKVRETVEQGNCRCRVIGEGEGRWRGRGQEQGKRGMASGTGMEELGLARRQGYYGSVLC